MNAVRERLNAQPYYGSDGQEVAIEHAQMMASRLETRGGHHQRNDRRADSPEL